MFRTVARRLIRVNRRILDRFSPQRPVIFGPDEVLGSFPPLSLQSMVGGKENYCLHDGYRSRQTPSYYNDTNNADEWQTEIYQYASEVAKQAGFRTVCDFGCGSAYKLLKFFPDHATIGVDVAETVAILRDRHPRRNWLESDWETSPTDEIDLFIASDVIEHVANPDLLMLYAQRLQPKLVILSTPDRNLLRMGSHDGPPINPHHIREWSFAEFQAYVAHFFEVREHFISCAAQATQCIVCVPKL